MSEPAVISSATSTVTASAPRRRWGRNILLLLLALVGLGVVAALFFLDPWLRRTLEDVVATASRGRYQLRIGELETSLWQGAATVRNVQLSTAAASPGTDTTALPDIRLDLGELRVTGIGLLAALRHQVVPIDSVVADSLRFRLGALPVSSVPQQPLYSRLPLGLPGVHIGHVAVRGVRARYGTSRRAEGQIAHATLQAHDLLLSAAGAADTARLGYARYVSGSVARLLARVPGHVAQLAKGEFSSRQKMLAISGLRLVPLRPVSAQRSPEARIDLDLPKAVLHGLGAAAMARGTLRADSLVLQGGRLAVTLPAVAPPPPHQLLAPYLPRIRVARVRLAGARLRVAGTEWAPAVQNINLRADSLHIDPKAYNAPGFLYYARSWQVQTGRARVSLDAPYYRLAASSMRLSTRQKELVLGLVQMAPTMTVAEQARRKGHQSAHVTLRLPQLALQGLDFPALLRQGSLRARQLELRNGRIVTSSDGRFPINPQQSVATPEAIGRLPFRVDVRQARITDAGIRMIYRSPRSAQVGAMAIGGLTATLRNISNDPRRMSAATPMTGEATGVLQKKSRARITLQANLLDPAGRHTLQGSFSAAPLAMLNPMVVPTRGIRLRSGQIEQIRFEMQLDRQQARGTMWAQYYGLKLDLLNKKNKRGVLHRVGTTLANGVFLRDNNPRQPGQELQTGQINSDRQLRFSVFSLWRQGLVSGLLNSAGVPKPLAKKLSEAE